MDLEVDEMSALGNYMGNGLCRLWYKHKNSSEV